jgi:ribosomal protein L4
MCGNTRPSILWDNLTAPQLATVKEAQTVLFLRKLPRHIRNLINPRAFKEPEDLIQRCNELWVAQTAEEAAAAAAPRQQSPFRGAHRSPSPFRRKGSGGDRSGRRRSPTPGPTTPASATSQKCEKDCSYQEN